MCDKNNNEREERKKELEAKLKKVEQCKNMEEKERSIVQEMLKDINKIFNNDDDYYRNQQLIGHMHLFRGIIVKEWAMGNHNNVNFHAHNKALVKSCVKFYCECWKRICIVLQNPEMQRKVLKEEVLVITEEAEQM